jgi:exopolysaccharide production protein ExoQ
MSLWDRSDATLHPVSTEPSRLEWIVAVFVLIVQQSAFVLTPQILSESSDSALPDVRNPFNTAAIVISIVSLGFICFPWVRQIARLLLHNRSSLLFMLLVLVSATWSIHPDLTMRRGVGYVLTMFIAAWLALRFDVVDGMKALSASFSASAVGSILFVAAFPSYGIMQQADLAGSWRGVFPHKNVLGPVMAFAVFTELFILVAGKGRPRWRWVSLCTYLALVALSHSATALLLSLAYLAGTGIYLIWQRNRVTGVGISIVGTAWLLGGLTTLWRDPQFALGILGRDTSLTGRTSLWPSVIGLIQQRPVLGWGYRAMWQPDDPARMVVDQINEWGASSSHNAFLEIALQLGLVGVAILVVIIFVALGRGLRCCNAGIRPLGWFSVMFIVGAILAAQTMETLGQNQVIEWVILNVLSFNCGLALASHRETGLAHICRHRPPGPLAEVMFPTASR